MSSTSRSRTKVSERLRAAVELLLEGSDLHTVAERSGMSSATLDHALARYRNGGWDSVIELSLPGNLARRKLLPQQEEQIHELVRNHTPDQLGTVHPLWNREALLEVIRNTTGVHFPTRTISTYQERWGFQPEKPVRTAYRVEPQVIREWMRLDFPLIAQQARETNGEVFWLGRIPLQPRERAQRRGGRQTIRSVQWPDGAHLLFMSANRGHVHWRVHQTPVTQADVIDLMERAHRARGQRLLFIVPNDDLFQDELLHSWARTHADRFELHTLPGLGSNTQLDGADPEVRPAI